MDYGDTKNQNVGGPIATAQAALLATAQNRTIILDTTRKEIVLTFCKRREVSQDLFPDCMHGLSEPI